MKFIVSKSSWLTEEDGQEAPCENAKMEKVVTLLNEEINVWTVEYESLEDVLFLLKDSKSPPILLDRTSVKEIPYCLVIYDDVSSRTISNDTLPEISQELLDSARNLNNEELCPGCDKKVSITSLNHDSGILLSYIECCNNLYFVGMEGKYLGESYDVKRKTKEE